MWSKAMMPGIESCSAQLCVVRVAVVQYNHDMSSATPTTEGDILERIIAAQDADLSVEAARSLLTLRFPVADTRRMQTLLRKNNAGRITANERAALDKYLRVGQFLDLIHAKAKASLTNDTHNK